MTVALPTSLNRQPFLRSAIAFRALTIIAVLAANAAMQLSAAEPTEQPQPPSEAAAKTPPKAKALRVEIATKFIEISGESEGLPDFLRKPDSKKAVGVRAILPASKANEAFRTLNATKGIDMLSAPRVVTRSNQRATVEISREWHAPDSAERIKVGVFLSVKPTVKNSGAIGLDASARVVEFEGFSHSPSKGGTANQKPVFTTRKVEGNVVLRPGQTVVLGAQTRTDVQQVEDKFPVLGDIPLLGRLFTHRYEQKITRHLFIFVTAKVSRR